MNDPVVVTGWGNFSSVGKIQTIIYLFPVFLIYLKIITQFFLKVDSGLSSVLRQINTNVISSSGTNGVCQQTAAEGSFSGDKVICSDGAQFRRYCYVILFDRMITNLH